MVFGALGKVGTELVARSMESHDHVTALARRDCDLSNPLNVARWIHTQKPDVVINAAAMNGMENVDKEPHFGFLINAAAPAVMARECAEVGALFVHYSTDYVFSALDDASIELDEYAPPRPASCYGWTKLSGEDAVRQCGDAYYLFRLSTIYGRAWAGPVSPIKQAAGGAGTSRENPLKIIRQFCAPTSARLVADATLHAIKAVPREDWRRARGTYHLTTREGVWREEFVRGALDMVFGKQPAEWEMTEAVLPLPRPVWSRLVSDRFQERFGYQLPTWREDLRQTLPLMPVVEFPAA